MRRQDHGYTNSGRKLIAAAVKQAITSPVAWTTLVLAMPGLALAGPSGESLQRGAATVDRPDANGTVINQSSSKAVLNWNSFSVGSGEYVTFRQPGSSSITLNRVVGVSGSVIRSEILGNLTANGQVFLINPRGVYFGPNSTVDVGGLIASTMDIGDDDFMAGNYVFTRDPDAVVGAEVVNEGVIIARENGYVVLAGDYVSNTSSGAITAHLGDIVLASGAQMTLTLDGGGLVNFAVDAATLVDLAGVNNSGALMSDGGRVIMTAQVASDLVGTAVNSDGLIRAAGIAERDGEVYLTALGGDIVQSGEIDVSGTGGQGGGLIEIAGDGDITLTAGGQLLATGSGVAQGGDVIIVADDLLDFQAGALVDVDGGEDGAGGFVELSGHVGLIWGGTVEAHGGTLLLDPVDVTIKNEGGGAPTCTDGVNVFCETTVENQLQNNTTVNIWASESITLEDLADGVLNGLSGVSGYGGGLELLISNDGDTPSSTGGTIQFLDTTDTIKVDGDFTAVAIADGYAGGAAAGYGDIDIGNIEARNIFVGSPYSGSSQKLARTVKTGDLTATGNGYGGGVNVQVFAAISVQTGNVAALTGSTNDDVNVVIQGGTLDIGNVTLQTYNYGGYTADLDIDGDGGSIGNVFVGGDNAYANIRNYAGSLTVDSVEVAGVGYGGAVLNGYIGSDLTVTGAVSVYAEYNATVSGNAYNLEIGSLDVQSLLDAEVSLNGGNSVTVNGDTNVVSASSASASFYSEGSVELGGINIESYSSGAGSHLSVNSLFSNIVVNGDVTVAAYSDADLNVSADNGNVTITGDTSVVSEYAYASADIYSYGNVQTGSLSVETQGSYAQANLDVYAEIGSLTVNGDVNVTSSGYGANADLHAEINVTVNGDITLAATSSDPFAYADADLVVLARDGNVTVTGDTSVVSESGDAYADLNSFDGNVQVGSVNVETSAAYSEAVLDIDAASGSVTVNGDIDVTSAGYGAIADLYAYDNLTVNGDTTVSNTTPSGDGYSSASLYAAARGQGGQVMLGGITVAAYEYAEVSVDGEAGVTVNGDISVTVAEAYSSYSSNEQAIVFLGSDSSVTAQNISVDLNFAGAAYSEADLGGGRVQLNDFYSGSYADVDVGNISVEVTANDVDNSYGGGAIGADIIIFGDSVQTGDLLAKVTTNAEYGGYNTAISKIDVTVATGGDASIGHVRAQATAKFSGSDSNEQYAYAEAQVNFQGYGGGSGDPVSWEIDGVDAIASADASGGSVDYAEASAFSNVLLGSSYYGDGAGTDNFSLNGPSQVTATANVDAPSAYSTYAGGSATFRVFGNSANGAGNAIEINDSITVTGPSASVTLGADASSSADIDINGDITVTKTGQSSGGSGEPVTIQVDNDNGDIRIRNGATLIDQGVGGGHVIFDVAGQLINDGQVIAPAQDGFDAESEYSGIIGLNFFENGAGASGSGTFEADFIEVDHSAAAPGAIDINTDARYILAHAHGDLAIDNTDFNGEVIIDLNGDGDAFGDVVIAAGGKLAFGENQLYESESYTISPTGLGPVTVESLEVFASGVVDMSNAQVTATHEIDLLSGGGDVLLNDATLSGESLIVNAAGDILIGGANVNADAVFLNGQNVLNGPGTSFTISDGTINSIGGDRVLIEQMLEAGLPVGSQSPNFAAIARGGALDLSGTTIDLQDLATYLWFQGDEILTASLTNVPNLSIVQMTPFSLTGSLSVDDIPGGGDTAFSFQTDILEAGIPDTPGTTVVFGHSEDPPRLFNFFNGNIFVGADSSFNAGLRNLIFISGAEIFGPGGASGINAIGVTSSGLILFIDLIVASEFEVPTTDEITEDVDQVIGLVTAAGSDEVRLLCN